MTTEPPIEPNKMDVVPTMSASPQPQQEEKANNEGGLFEWRDVDVTIEGYHILHNVNGQVAKGQLLGILGGSGAGKSTLLNAISGRLLSQTPNPISANCCIPKCKSIGTQVTGDIAWDSKQFKLGNDSSVKYLCAYVMQSDVMCPTSTAEEALQFSALLKLEQDVSPEERQQLVSGVLKSLKLTDCKTTMIGNDAIRGMSGGEKKRTSVGVELVTNPNLIFLDEPTSGLDSFTALRTLEILKSLTQQGKQVIATIHQPSSEIFRMLDQLCVLADGHVVYSGASSDVIGYFKSLPGPADNPMKYHCPEYTNPADFVINRVQEDSPFFIEQWKEFMQQKRANDDWQHYSRLVPETKHSSGCCRQLSAILKREFQTLQRDPRPVKIRLVQTIIFALLVGILYLQLPHTQEGLRDRFGAIFFITINSSITGLVATMIVFPEQRLLFERERNTNMYSTSTYLVAKSLIHLPEQALFTLLYQLIVFWMVGLDSEFWEFYISLFLCMTTTGSVGLLIGCFANNTQEAMQIMPMGFIPYLLFAGFLVSLDQIPVWIRWLQWIDPFKYMIDAVCVTEFRGQTYKQETSATGEKIGYPSGDSYLESIDVTNTDKNLYFDWYMLVVLLVAFRILIWIVLVKRNGW